MDWKLSWTEEAMSSNHDDVLELMLRYRQHMVEEKPCRRFINTLTHAMANGESLTSLRKQYLKAFCTVPAVVKRQQHDLIWRRAAPSHSRMPAQKWQAIQSAIYE